ncbi:hypothetical protein Tco_1202346 [Tanacetum coccineum]
MVKYIDLQLQERRLIEAWKSLLVEGNTGKTLDCFSRNYDIVIFCSTILGKIVTYRYTLRVVLLEISGNSTAVQCEKPVKEILLEFYYSQAVQCDLDNSTSNVLIPLDSWTSGLLVYKLPLSGWTFSNVTMEDYIRLEEEKACKRGKVFNWQTATYGKIRVDDDFYDLRSMEAEFLAIVSLRHVSYKYFCQRYLKTDSENNNDKVNIPLLPSPKPTVSYFDDLDFFKDFENKFPAIVYNDALTSKLDFLTDLILSNEFDLKSETSLSECNEEEQNVLCFNDLFPFNVIYPHDLKSDTGNDNDKIDIEQPSGDMSVKPLPDLIKTNVGAYAHESNKLLETMS